MSHGERAILRSLRTGYRLGILRLRQIGVGIGCSVALLAAAVTVTVAVHTDRHVRTTELPATDSQPLETFAGVPPVAWLVNRIGGSYVRVETLVEPGKDPHIFEPTPRQVIALGRARLFFCVGMPFEDRLVEHIAAGPGRMTIVDTAAGIAHRTPGHGEHDDDDEGKADPHVWLSPPLLKAMAANISAALCQADPRHEPVYRGNLKTLEAELDALDRRIAQSLTPYRGQTFYVFHPAFGYFADRYGLRQESVEIEGKPPTPRQIFGLISKARDDHVTIIFLQPQFNQQVAASIAQAIDGAVMPMDSLTYDVAANLDDIAAKIATSNQRKSP
jgi:zinc transport system substrate-binding protein